MLRILCCGEVGRPCHNNARIPFYSYSPSFDTITWAGRTTRSWSV